jgi:hypothetical protein
MVVLMLLAIVLPVAYGSVNAMQRQVVFTSDRFQALSEAQIITDRITKDLRTGVSPANGQAPFLKATPNEVQFYASLTDPNGPTLLHAYVSPIFAGSTVNAFHEDSLKVDSAATPYQWTGTVRSRLDGEYVDTTTPTIFTYFDINGVQLVFVGSPLALAAGDLSNVDSIGITLTTRIRPTSPATTITTLVHVRNVDYNPNGGG